MTAEEHDPYRDDDDMVTSKQLRDLFERRRPDPQRFHAGVAERLGSAAGPGSSRAHGGDGGHGSGGGSGRSPNPTWARWQRRAAGLFPGLSSGGSSGSWTTLLSLPALVLFAVFTMFFRSSRELDASVEAAPDRPADPRLVQVGRRALLFVMFITMPIAASALGLWFLDIRADFDSATTVDTALAVVIVGMALVTFFLGQFVRARGARIAEVGNFVIVLQFTVLLGCVVHVSIFGIFDPGSALGYGAAGWVLAAGIVLCGVITFWLSRDLYAPVMVVIVVVMMPNVLLSGFPDNSAGAIRERLAAAASRLDPAELTGWQTAATMHEILEEATEPSVDLTAARERLATTIQQQVAQERLDPILAPVVGHASRLGLVTAAQWQQLAADRINRYRVRSLLRDTRPLDNGGVSRFLLDLVFATREMTADERAHVARRVDASWPDPGEPKHGDLDQAVRCIEWLERLGHGDRIESRSELLHELLSSRFVSEARADQHSFPGGFGMPPSLGHSATAATSRALAIIARVGAPADVPLSHVRAYLRHSARPGQEGATDETTLKMLARAEHYRLTHTIGLPARSPLEVLIGERLLIASALLVILCLRALLLANRNRIELAVGPAGAGGANAVTGGALP